MGENVKTINDGAFAGCSNLSSLIFRGPLPQIGTSVFSGCTALADADGFIIIDHILFGYVGNDEHVQIPTGVLAIGGAFADQTAICSVSISDTVTEVKNYAFAGCKKLKELIIPANVEVFCYHAIAHCTKLKKLVFRSAKTRVISGVYWPGNIKPTIYAPKGSFAETYEKKTRSPSWRNDGRIYIWKRFCQS